MEFLTIFFLALASIASAIASILPPAPGLVELGVLTPDGDKTIWISDKLAHVDVSLSNNTPTPSVQDWAYVFTAQTQPSGKCNYDRFEFAHTGTTSPAAPTIGDCQFLAGILHTINGYWTMFGWGAGQRPSAPEILLAAGTCGIWFVRMDGGGGLNDYVNVAAKDIEGGINDAISRFGANGHVGESASWQCDGYRRLVDTEFYVWVPSAQPPM